MPGDASAGAGGGTKETAKASGLLPHHHSSVWGKARQVTTAAHRQCVQAVGRPAYDGVQDQVERAELLRESRSGGNSTGPAGPVVP